MWEQIVVNLVGNALKFCKQGSINVTLKANRQFVVLHVTDTGSGIAAGDTDMIFEPFHLPSGSARQGGRGTGIGLALTQQ